MSRSVWFQLRAVGALVHEWRLLSRLDGGLQPLERGRPAVPDVARGDGRGELAEALEHDVVLHPQERPIGSWAQAVAHPAGKGFALLGLLEQSGASERVTLTSTSSLMRVR